MRLFIVVFYVLFTSLLLAQNSTQGTIVYKLHYAMDDSSEDKYDTLHFSENNWVYIIKRIASRRTNEEGVQITQQPWNHRSYYFAGDDSWIALNQNYRKKRIEYEEMPATKFKWKIHDKFKTIGEYKAQKATLRNIDFKDMEAVDVWFTTDIMVSAGPKGIYGLPGLILEARFYRDYDHSYTVESINFRPTNITRPDPEKYYVDKKKKRKKVDRSKLNDALRGN